MGLFPKDVVRLRGAALAVCTAAALTAAIPTPAAASGEFVTSGPCTNRVFEVDSDELRLDVYERETTVTLWGSLMSFARFPTSSNAAVTVSLRNPRSATTNAINGCDRLGSIDLVLKPNGALSTPQKTTVTVQYWIGSTFSGTFALPVTMQALEPQILWGATGALANCLARQNGTLARVPGGRELTIVIPRDLRIEPCLGSLVIDARLVPNSFIDGSPDSLTWQVDRFGLVANRFAARTSDTAACLRGECRPQVPLRVDLDWARLAALPQGSSVVVRANVFFGETGAPDTTPDVNDPRRLEQLRVTVNTSDAASGFPVACCTTDPSSGPIGTTVTFNPICSAAGDSPITNYHWEFGDLAGAELDLPSPNSVSHTYSSGSGLFTATLTVTDAEGKASTDECEVFIEAPQP